MPRRKLTIQKQRLNTTVRGETIKMLDALSNSTGLDRGQLLDSLVMDAFERAGLTLEDEADATPDALAA